MTSVVDSAIVAGLDLLVVPVIDFEVDSLEGFGLDQMSAVETDLGEVQDVAVLNIDILGEVDVFARAPAAELRSIADAEHSDQ
jgi:hypothetical protein